MNFKKNWKRFWTLSSAREGFTLVELIVVIAILAILAGVAVPAYSGYVKKANMQADITLVSEIKHALVLAHYAGTIQPGATVTVYYGDTDATATVDDGADAAMKAVFGNGYTESLRLSYDGWDAGPASSKEVMQYVENSNFSRNEMNSLLNQVQSVVDAFNTYSVGMTFDESDFAYDYMQMAGITGNTVTAENANAFANATVFGVAGNIGDILSDSEAKDTLVGYWSNGGFFPDNVYDPLTQKTLEYAFTLALAKHADSLAGDGSTTYADMLTSGVNAEGANNKDVINGNIAAVQEAIFADDFPYADAMNIYFNGDSEGNKQIVTDALSFLAYMDGVSKSSESILENNSLYKENFFNDGTMAQYVDNYFDASAILQNVPNGAIVCIYNGTDIIFCTPDPAYN